MISVAGEANLINGFRPVINGPTVSHLKFVDDTNFFFAAKEQQIKNVVAILECFEAVSDLKVNFSKSDLIGIEVEVQFLEVLATIMECSVGSLPTSYLKLPLCLGRASKQVWNPVVEKVEQKLASCKAKYLSFRGRIILIHLALTFQSTSCLSSNVQQRSSIELRSFSGTFYGRPKAPRERFI